MLLLECHHLRNNLLVDLLESFHVVPLYEDEFRVPTNVVTDPRVVYNKDDLLLEDVLSMNRSPVGFHGGAEELLRSMQIKELGLVFDPFKSSLMLFSGLLEVFVSIEDVVDRLNFGMFLSLLNALPLVKAVGLKSVLDEVSNLTYRFFLRLVKHETRYLICQFFILEVQVFIQSCLQNIISLS